MRHAPSPRLVLCTHQYSALERTRSTAHGADRPSLECSRDVCPGLTADYVPDCAVGYAVVLTKYALRNALSRTFADFFYQAFRKAGSWFFIVVLQTDVHHELKAPFSFAALPFALHDLAMLPCTFRQAERLLLFAQRSVSGKPPSFCALFPFHRCQPSLNGSWCFQQ